MNEELIRAIEKQPDPPCDSGDGCAMREKCGRNERACQAFGRYVRGLPWTLTQAREQRRVLMKRAARLKSPGKRREAKDRAREITNTYTDPEWTPTKKIFDRIFLDDDRIVKGGGSV